MFGASISCLEHSKVILERWDFISTKIKRSGQQAGSLAQIQSPGHLISTGIECKSQEIDQLDEMKKKAILS